MKLSDNNLVVQNPQAQHPLELQVHSKVALLSELAQANFAANNERQCEWVNAIPAHDRVAALCGSGSSLKDTRADIVGDIFALNGAANYLFERGLSIPYQVVLDPNHFIAEYYCEFAETHLAASTAPTAYFERSGNVMLWQPDIKWVETALVDSPKEFTYIGGGISVGVYALALAYALGYRTIHCYGYDSSYSGDSYYASGRGVDDGQLLCTITHDGRDYPTNMNMKEQVTAFMYCAKLLIKEGAEIHVHGTGLLPDVFNSFYASGRACPHSTT